MENKVPTSADRRETKAAADLKPGDRIAEGFLPTGEASEVLFVHSYQGADDRYAWALVVYRWSDGTADADHFIADKQIPVEPTDPTGLGFSREADDPTPVSPARVPLHTGGVVEGGQLVDETLPPHKQDAANPLHPLYGQQPVRLQTRPQCSPECLIAYADNEIFATQHLDTCPVAHAKAQDGRVTRYFSFGHGHVDPKTGEKLLDKYVTVVAPDIDACRSGMLAKYGRKWSMEYTPGNPSSDKWIDRWTEHERITVISVADCDCPVLAYPEGRGDSSDTITVHVDGYCTLGEVL